MQHTTSHESQSVLAVRDDEDYIDLRPIFTQIWKARKLIVVGTVLIVAAALLANEFFGKYWSEGRIKVIGVSPIAYKGFQVIFSDVNRFRAYVKEEGIGDKKTAAFVEELLSLPSERLERYASIAKPIGPKDTSKDNELEFGAVFVGMDLRIPGPSPDAAQLRSRLFADYFADTFIYSDLLKWLDSMESDKLTTAYSIKLEAMKIHRSIDEQKMRLVALRSLAKRFPESLRMGPSPVISVDVKNEVPGAPKSEGDGARLRRASDEGFERFLSPVVQMVAVESAIIDGEIDLFKLQRKQKRSDLSSKFYKQAVAIGATTKGGRDYLKELTTLAADFSREISTSDTVGTEFVNEISYELEQRQYRYASGFKFLSGPSLPEGRNKKNPLLVILGAGAGGIFVMVVFALFTSWWRKNTKFLADDNGPTAAAT